MPFHVIQRGNNRSACFGAIADYERYLALLTDRARWHGVAVHAYVLMTNHIHLLLTPRDEDGLTSVMKALGQMYAQYINRKYGRSGSLWDGRFRSCLVETESYLLCCHRYIEANPVRAGMVEHPDDYPWSSYRANALGAANPMLSVHPSVEALGRTPMERQASYRALFEGELAPAVLEEIRTSTLSGHALGSPLFRRRIARELGRPVDRQKRGPKARKLSV
jgi:putative transposase